MILIFFFNFFQTRVKESFFLQFQLGNYLKKQISQKVGGKEKKKGFCKSEKFES